MAGSFLVPDEDGVLVLSKYQEQGVPYGPSEEALSLAVNSGGSGAGMSHFSSAARCGRRARLSAERYQRFRDEKAALPPSKNHFIVGSVYHKLHELIRKKPVSTMLDLNERWQNPSVAEGVRLYKGWMRHWSVDFWGKCLDVEVQLEDRQTFIGPVYKDAAAEGYGRVTVTGAMDMVVEMDAEACERAKRRGLDLTPGRRIVDWKTSDAPSDGSNYGQGLQTLWYPYLWNLHFPDTPVDGIIYDVINKRGRRKDRSVLTEDFQAYYFPAGMESIQSLRGMVMQGHRNIAEDIPNRAECSDWRGQVCPFRLSGECDAT